MQCILWTCSNLNVTIAVLYKILCYVRPCSIGLSYISASCKMHKNITSYNFHKVKQKYAKEKPFFSIQVCLSHFMSCDKVVSTKLKWWFYQGKPCCCRRHWTVTVKTRQSPWWLFAVCTLCSPFHCTRNMSTQQMNQGSSKPLDSLAD